MVISSAPSLEILTKHGSNCQCPIWHARCRGVKPGDLAASPVFSCWLKHQEHQLTALEINYVSHIHTLESSKITLESCRGFLTSGCPEIGYIPIYGYCFVRKMNINQWIFGLTQFLTVSGCLHYPHKNSHIE